MGRTATKQMTVEQIQAEIDKEFVRWNDIYRNGCSDPFWEDGANLNLVRNHIIYWYRLLDETSDAPVQLSLFGAAVSLEKKHIPPEVSTKYMAKPDSLRRRVERTLKTVLQDPNYRYIVSLQEMLSDFIKKKCSYDAIVRYPDSMVCALKREDYPRMRAYQDTAYWKKTYARIRKNIEEALQEEKNGKFAMLPLEDDSEEYDED